MVGDVYVAESFRRRLEDMGHVPAEVIDHVVACRRRAMEPSYSQGSRAEEVLEYLDMQSGQRS